MPPPLYTTQQSLGGEISARRICPLPCTPHSTAQGERFQLGGYAPSPVHHTVQPRGRDFSQEDMPPPLCTTQYSLGGEISARMICPLPCTPHSTAQGERFQLVGYAPSPVHPTVQHRGRDFSQEDMPPPLYTTQYSIGGEISARRICPPSLVHHTVQHRGRDFSQEDMPPSLYTPQYSYCQDQKNFFLKGYSYWGSRPTHTYHQCYNAPWLPRC